LLACSFDTFSTAAADRAYVIVLIIFGYFVPLCVIVASYTGMFVSTRSTRIKLTQHRLAQGAGRSYSFENNEETDEASCGCLNSLMVIKNKPRKSSPNNQARLMDSGSQLQLKTRDEYARSFLQKTVKTEQTLARMALLLVSIWVLTWTPYAAAALMNILGRPDFFPPQMHLAALLLAKASAVINAVVYGLRLPTFRRKMSVMKPAIPAPLLSLLAGTDSDPNVGTGAQGNGQSATAAQFRAVAALRQSLVVSFAEGTKGSSSGNEKASPLRQNSTTTVTTRIGQPVAAPALRANRASSVRVYSRVSHFTLSFPC